MPIAVKTTEILPDKVPNLKPVPQAIEMQMEAPDSFIEETKKQDNLPRIGNFLDQCYKMIFYQKSSSNLCHINNRKNN